MRIFGKFTLALAALASFATVGGANQRAYGFCTAGGQSISVVGLNGTPEAQSSYPGCTVTVFLTGTTNLATIFKDNVGTALGNPFTADSITGYWEFYAANGRYDAVLTGAGIPNPGFTFGDILLCDGCGTGASPGGVSGDVQTNNGTGGFAGGTPLTSLARTGAGSVYALNLASQAGQTLFCDTQSLAGGSNCVVSTLTTVSCSGTNPTPSFACPGSVYPCSTAGPASDVGKLAWGCSGSPNCSLLFNTSIASIQSATALTLTAGIANGTLSTFRYGHDDTPAWDAVNTAFNIRLLSSASCLILPAGLSWVKHGTLLVNPTTSYSLGNYPACYISPGTLFFSPTPDFVWDFFKPGVRNIEFISTAQGTANFGSGSPSFITNIGVDGGGLNSGTGVCNVAGLNHEGMFLSQTESSGVTISNWCPGVAFSPIVMDNVQEDYNLSCVNSGLNCVTSQSGTDNAPGEIHGGQITSTATSGCGILVNSSALNTSHISFAGPKTEVCMQGGTWHSKSDNFPQAGGGGPQSGITFSSTASNVWVDDCFGSTVAGFDWAVLGGANTALHYHNCKFNVGAGNKICNTSTNGGKCFDDGGNISIGSTLTDAQCTSSASPAVCGTAQEGNVTIASGATTITVNTTVVTPASKFSVTENMTLGGTLSVTCNTTQGRTYAVTTITAGTSFVITASAAPTTNPACLQFKILNAGT